MPELVIKTQKSLDCLWSEVGGRGWNLCLWWSAFSHLPCTFHFGVGVEVYWNCREKNTWNEKQKTKPQVINKQKPGEVVYSSLMHAHPVKNNNDSPCSKTKQTSKNPNPPKTLKKVIKLDMVVDNYNPSTQDSETQESWIEGQTGLRSEIFKCWWHSLAVECLALGLISSLVPPPMYMYIKKQDFKSKLLTYVAIINLY